MTKETGLSLLRSLIMLVGSFLIGHKLFNQAVDAPTWEIWGGALLSLGSLVWSVVDKSLGIEMLQTTIRQVLTAAGGILIASGKLDSARVESIVGFVLAALPFLYGILSRKKSASIITGKISVDKLKL